MDDHTKERFKALDRKVRNGDASADEQREYRRILRDTLSSSESREGPDTRGYRPGVTTVSADNMRLARERRHLIGRDTHDLPEPGDGRPLEARHDLGAYLSQRKDYNQSGMDWRSFDRSAFYRQLITGNQAGREYRALAEGSQSVTASGGGWLAPVAFSASVLPLLRANLVWTSPGADGTVNGPMVHDMNSQVEYVPVWQSDGSGLFSWLAENSQMTPVTSTLGVQKLTAYTMAGVVLASRQLVEDSTADVAELIESNMALGAARALDQAALYGTGSGQPAGILTSAYSAIVQSVSMGANGAAPVNYNQMSQAVEQVRTANDNPTGIFTNPQVYGTYSRLNVDAYGKYYDVPQDVKEFWPPHTSTAFSATEAQGTSNAASSALVLNANRVMLGLRMSLGFQILHERFADYLQTGFLFYIRADWEFPYAAAASRVQGILTT